ncbi:MAG TPA: hypothetical protein ENH57_04630 [Actinobacteria bacterium]|nr:hypothetical protein [Actinomycetota bacterium]
MDLTSYLSARDIVSNVGQPLLYLSLGLSVLLVVSGFSDKLRRYNRHILSAILVSLAAGFLLLIWFHFRINSSLPLINPLSNEFVGRYYVPPWIENEKIFFWTLLTVVWLLFMRRRSPVFQTNMNFVVLTFLALTVFTSNPFVEPLGSFNSQITQISEALASSDQQAVMGGLYGAQGMMEGFYNSPYMWLHPPLTFIAYSAFVISFFGSMFMLIKKDLEYERFAYNWIRVGYIALTVGMLVGFPWAMTAWEGQPWWYSPKVNVTIMMWVIYTAYLHSRLYLTKRGMFSTTAALGIFGFIAVVATYLSTYVLPGIHSMAGGGV